MNITVNTATKAWYGTLIEVMAKGDVVSPRGMRTLEMQQHTVAVDMIRPVVRCPTRKLSEKFLGGEALWILTGDDRVETISRYNKRIADFSDDGVTFFGAYGPKFVNQVQYVVDKLIEDQHSRQAGMTFWRENPKKTKDVPCTVAAFFNIRDNGSVPVLNANFFMRSNDVWLGMPYDMFNFSMMANYVCGSINQRNVLNNFNLIGKRVLRPGTLFLTAASRHIYSTNEIAAGTCIANDIGSQLDHSILPNKMYENPAHLVHTLREIAEGNEAEKWWKK